MKAYDVAPARERGLKLELAIGMIPLLGRSREGAWIEIAVKRILHLYTIVAPARERGLKSLRALTAMHSLRVAPARERGLKFQDYN